MFYSHIKGIGTSCLKLMQLYQWDILKQNFFVAIVLDMENFQLNILQKKWNHFLDDCHTLLKSSKISPEDLLLTLNTINPSIKFTMEYTLDQLTFPHISIKRKENGIWILPYTQRHTKCLTLHLVTQTIISKVSHFIWHKAFELLQKKNPKKLRNLENFRSN